MSVADVAQERDQLAVSVDEAARLLGVSRDLVYDLVRRGELPAVRLGRRIVIPYRSLERLLEAGSTADAGGELSDDARSPITAAASRSATSRKWA